MDFLSWNDFIQPTNPLASIFFGFIFTIIVTVAAWLETKEKKTAIIFFITGVIIVIIGVFALSIFGYYK
ncbi:hypothetical protein [Paucisalibacillus globulus]|uniref:hypothetical protein n=1 Tax=Paucisalibacillus globulus TaxID=351095 RepID=UPI00041DADE0|nr:hypothetical protein [Paucisalibacillus globulus]